MSVQKYLFPERKFRLAIAPWNAPATLSFRAICIPLICGNTVVLKSSEYSPISQEIVVEVMHEVCGFELSTFFRELIYLLGRNTPRRPKLPLNIERELAETHR